MLIALISINKFPDAIRRDIHKLISLAFLFFKSVEICGRAERIKIKIATEERMFK